MVNINDIESTQWSTSIANFGDVVTDIEDVKQCLFILICTRKGTAPFWPDFGCGAFDWIGQPMTEAIPKIIRDIRIAIETYETRAIIQTISHQIKGDGTAIVSVLWRPIAGTRQGAVISSVFSVTSRGIAYLVDEYNNRFLTEFGVIIL